MSAPRTEKRTPKGWTLGRTTIDTVMGAQDVKAYLSPRAPGLCVTETIGDARLYGRWTVTLIESGWRTASPQETLAKACRLALQLASLGDWARDGESMKADTAMHDRVKAFYAEAHLYKTPPASSRSSVVAPPPEMK